MICKLGLGAVRMPEASETHGKKGGHFTGAASPLTRVFLQTLNRVL